MTPSIMSICTSLPCLRLAAATVLLGLVGCQGLPTLESIKHGYRPPSPSIQSEQPRADDYNDVAAGWAPESHLGGTAAKPTALYGRDGRPVTMQPGDGSPVGASAPGAVTETKRPINGGVAADPTAGGSRDTMLEKYLGLVDEIEALRPENEDLHLALEMSELRANDYAEQLKSIQLQYDELGKSKQNADGQAYELAARLATAQIARLEAERALLEATLEWRRMSAASSDPMDESQHPAASAGARR